MNQDILFDVKNNLGIIILNRPKALNALSHDMFIALKSQLTQWRDDASIKAVLIRSNCEKAFCAGGDIRAIYENRNQPVETVGDYFRLEYEINRIIFHFSKPYIALAHGITMGGGVGISIQGSHCAAADNLRWAMPETMIGFFPDVGVTYYLSRLPDYIGTYLALTGNSIDAQTALHLNLIEEIVPYHHFDALEEKLVKENFSSNDFEAVTKIIHLFSQNVDKNNLPIEKISTHFCFETIEKIIESLKIDSSEWAQETVNALLHRSPTSLKITLQQLHLAKNKTFDEVIAMDNHIARIMLTNHDFFEGVRAAIIDKDKNPKWKPEKLVEVSEKMISEYF